MRVSFAVLGSYLQHWTKPSAEGRYATGGRAGASGSGSGSDGMHCFRQFRLRLRAPKGDRPGKNQPFFHFDFKICLHNISYHKTRQNAFVSRILIPLIRSSFGAGPPFLTDSLLKNGRPEPFRFRSKRFRFRLAASFRNANRCLS